MTTILYLHGFASGPASRKALCFKERLERAGARVLVPDLAEGEFERLTISRQLAVVERAAHPGGHALPVALIGSSMGGYLAALYAARHAEVQRLVLLAPAFGFARRWPERLGPEAFERWRTTGAMDVYHYALQRNCRVGFELIADGSSYEDEPDFPQPALIFHGAHDDVVPAVYSERFARHHPNARLEIVDSDHELLNVLDAIVPAAAAFLGC